MKYTGQTSTKYKDAFLTVSIRAAPDSFEINEVNTCHNRNTAIRYNNGLSMDGLSSAENNFTAKSIITPTTPIDDNATLNCEVMKLIPIKIKINRSIILLKELERVKIPF